MSGHWTDLWDDTHKRWLRVWIDLPKPLARGSAVDLAGEQPPALFGADGKPIRPEPRKVGFHK